MTHTVNYSDKILVQRASAGDIAAFESLIRNYEGFLRRTAHKLTRDVCLAEDIVQETWIKVYRSMSKCKGQASFATWLSRIAINTYLDVSKRKKLETLTDEDIEAYTDSPRGSSAIASLTITAFLDELLGLGMLFEQYEVLVYRWEEDWHYQEIAEIMGLSAFQVKKREIWAHQFIREHFDNVDGRLVRRTGSSLEEGSAD